MVRLFEQYFFSLLSFNCSLFTAPVVLTAISSLRLIPASTQENKPEDPLRYIHQRFGEKVVSSSLPQKDATMSDFPQKTLDTPILASDPIEDTLPAQPQPPVAAANRQPPTQPPLSEATPIPAVALAPEAAPAPVIPAQTAPAAPAPALVAPSNAAPLGAPQALEPVVVVSNAPEAPAEAPVVPAAVQQAPAQ